MLLIGIIIAFIALIIASITDLRNREVPDYVSYGLICVAFTVALVNTILTWNYIPIAQSAMGFLVGLIIAYAMFYMGQWGGGDSKLMMGLGAIIGFNIFPQFNIAIFGENNIWLVVLIVSIILFGAIYGLVWSVFLAIKNRKQFIKSMNERLQKREILITRRIMLTAIFLMIIAILTIIPQEFKILMLSFVVMLYFVFYIWLFVKIIEETCMVKDISISRLTEGDWIFKDVYVGKKLITGPKDLGISREQIVELKKYAAKGKIKTVTIKEGIPFIPAFLIAYVATIIMYFMGVF